MRTKARGSQFGFDGLGRVVLHPVENLERARGFDDQVALEADEMLRVERRLLEAEIVLGGLEPAHVAVAELRDLVHDLELSWRIDVEDELAARRQDRRNVVEKRAAAIR